MANDMDWGGNRRSKVAVGSRRAGVPQQEEDVAWGGVVAPERTPAEY